jgi:DNA-binding XRE family transcriptional regulator
MPKPSTTEFIGSNFRKFREEAGFSHQQLADAVNELGRLNVSWRHIYRLDHNESAPSLPLAQDLALILGKEINEIWERVSSDED